MMDSDDENVKIGSSKRFSGTPDARGKREVAKGGSWRRIAYFRIPVLLQETPFRRFFIASTTSVLGDGVSSLAIPLVAASILHATPLEMGYLTALNWTPSLVLSVHAGALADHLGRRKQIMIAADVARCLLLASIPAAYLFHVLTLTQLFVVVFGAGALSVLFNVSSNAVFSFLVRPVKYVEAQSLLYGGQEVATLGGPSAAGFLVQLMAAPLAVALDAASFLLSAGLLSRINYREPQSEGGKMSILPLDGLRFIKSNQTVRPILSATATINFFTSITQALLVIYFTKNLHLNPEVLGFFFAASALGGVIGSSITSSLSRRVGVGRTLLAGCIIYCAPDIFIPLAHGPTSLLCTVLLLQAIVTGVGAVLENISIGAIFAAVVPDNKRASVRGAFQTISFGMRPFGALVGGIIGSDVGIRPALWVGALGASAGFVWILFSPVLDFRILLRSSP